MSPCQFAFSALVRQRLYSWAFRAVFSAVSSSSRWRSFSFSNASASS